jgi:hypothetical protein
MVDETDKEFASCRELFDAEEARVAFDQQVKLLLENHGIDYVRGYVAALKDIMPRKVR